MPTAQCNLLPRSGYILFAIAVAHESAAWAFSFREPFVRLIKQGWVNVVTSPLHKPENLCHTVDWDILAAINFHSISLYIAVLAHLSVLYEKQSGKPLPLVLGLGMLFISLISLIIQPISGAFLVLIVSGIIITRSLRSRSNDKSAKTKIFNSHPSTIMAWVMIVTGIVHSSLPFFDSSCFGIVTSEVLKSNEFWMCVTEGPLTPIWDRMAIWWFFIQGILWIITGILMRAYVLDVGRTIPKSVGIGVFVGGLLATAVPLGGFWLFFLIGGAIIYIDTNQQKSKKTK